MTEIFKTDVQKGLSASPKFLSSKYFYDKTGDELFQQIMDLPEYYLTRSELEIFQEKCDELIEAFDIAKDEFIEIVELGAGDGTKTKELLKVMLGRGYQFEYIPIDISANALDLLHENMKDSIPNLNMSPKQGDIMHMMADLKSSPHRKIVLFLGSNLGNLPDQEASSFIYDLGANLKPNDRLLLGLDLIKDESIVLPAYNDNKGVTSAFNLNLLNRMNSELGANFDLQKFEHAPVYEQGIAKSYIVSKEDQEVHFRSINCHFQFEKDEKIHTEISRKYDDRIIEAIIRPTDFSLKGKILDSKGYFADYILSRD